MMNPLTWSSASSRAQITTMSAKVELPIHFFWPFRTQVSPWRRAVVVTPPEMALPTWGSVRPKAPMVSHDRILGSHSAFCSSEPQTKTDCIASPEWTPKNVAVDTSTRAISIVISPSITEPLGSRVSRSSP